MISDMSYAAGSQAAYEKFATGPIAAQVTHFGRVAAPGFPKTAPITMGPAPTVAPAAGGPAFGGAANPTGPAGIHPPQSQAHDLAHPVTPPATTQPATTQPEAPAKPGFLDTGMGQFAAQTAVGLGLPMVINAMTPTPKQRKDPNDPNDR